MMFYSVFIFTGVLHLYFNWKPFKKYLAKRIRGRLEAFHRASWLLVVIDSYSVSWVLQLNEDTKDALVMSPDTESLFGHAEEISLAGLTRHMRLNLSKAEQTLREAGLAFSWS